MPAQESSVMSVSQRSVFVGQDDRPYPGDNLGLWTTTGTAPTEGVALGGPPPSPSLYVGGGYGPALSVNGAADLPGSLVLAVDGAPGGPLYVTDPVTGLASELAVLPDSTPNDLVSTGTLVLFNAGNGAGNALWRTDGTVGGTVQVAVPAAPAGLAPSNLYAYDGGALFTGYGADNAVDVYFTDGTTAGTREIAAFAPQVQPGIFGGYLDLLPPTASFDPIGTLGGRVVFVGPGNDPNGGGYGLWSTDGTAAGTTPIAATSRAPVGSSVVLGGRLLYAAGADNFGEAAKLANGGLYATDGTAAGSVEVSALGTAGTQSQATDLTLVGAGAVFEVFTSNGNAAPFTTTLWATDGTAAGTLPIVPDLYATGITALGDGEAVFAGTPGQDASGQTGLYVTDGTAAGTREIVAGLAPASITALADGTAEFAAGGALYVTDGTAAGTRIVPGSAGLNPTAITVLPSPLAFTGTQAQYALAPAGDGALQARDLSAAGSGALDLPGARVLTFGDGTTAVFDASGNAEAIARLYLAAYGQAPDLAGLLAYTQQADAGTVSLAQIAAAAPVSAQFLAGGSLSDAQFVTRLYENADGRAPDAGGLAGYTQALATGQTRGQVLLAIAESPEARVHSQAVAGSATDATVTRLYEAIDGRAPDAGGLAAYASALDGGQSVAQIAAAMLGSQEYMLRFGTPQGDFAHGAPGNAAFVTELYANLLGRAPDASGLAGYTAALAGGESRAQLVAGFVASDEARLATGPLTHLGYVSL